MWLDQWLVKQIAKVWHWRYGDTLQDETLKWGRRYESARHAAMLGQLAVCGVDITLRAGVQLIAPEKIRFGDHIGIGYNTILQAHAGITLDNFVLLGDNNILATSSHPLERVRFHQTWTKPIHIKENAWLGASVVVLPGITIGENAAIGAGAVVTQDIPDNAVAVGVPAQVIRTIEFDPASTHEQKRAIRAARLRKIGLSE